MTQIYKIGTVTVTNGSTAVSGEDTAWATALVTGGLFTRDGLAVPIESVTDEDTLVLALPWPGPSSTGAYAILRENSAAASVVDLFDRMTRALITLSLHSIHPNAVGTLAERDALTLGAEETQFVFLRLETAQPDEYYRWGGAAWVGPFPVRGPAGPPGIGEGGYGLPTGGTTGQVPAKASNDDGDVEWVTPADPELAAGDILTDPGGTFEGADVEAVLDDHDGRIVDLEGEIVEKVDITAVREKLTADRTYYVRTDGSDSNTGLVNSSGGAFRTIQKAIDVARALDLAIYRVTVDIGAGTFAENISCGTFIGGNSTAQVVIKGAGRASTTIGLGSGTAVAFTGPVVAQFGNLKFAASQSIALHSDNGATVTVNQGAIEVQTCSSRYFNAQNGATILFGATGGDVYMSGNAPRALRVQYAGRILISTSTWATTTAIAFSQDFAGASDLGAIIRTGTVTFDVALGAITGKRYNVDSNALINTIGQGASFFPGNSAGTDATGGVYA